ncbi:MAG: peptidoglycan-binding protein [Planctomycetota bacterium]|nr:MAG: peptidoglycan-binding protein [Planctomycetota bacterium]
MDGNLEIHKSVGICSFNLLEDVLCVQRALNRLPMEQGGPMVSIPEDGKAGPVTRRAIRLFQAFHFGWDQADGCMTPQGQSWKRLQHCLAGTDSAAPTPHRNEMEPESMG